MNYMKGKKNSVRIQVPSFYLIVFHLRWGMEIAPPKVGGGQEFQWENRRHFRKREKGN